MTREGCTPRGMARGLNRDITRDITRNSLSARVWLGRAVAWGARDMKIRLPKVLPPQAMHCCHVVAIRSAQDSGTITFALIEIW